VELLNQYLNHPEAKRSAFLQTEIHRQADAIVRHSEFNVAAFRSVETFKKEVTDFAHYLKATPPAEGFTEVYYPGEIEYRKEQDRRKNGIPVEDATWNKVRELAQGYGLTEKLGL